MTPEERAIALWGAIHNKFGEHAVISERGFFAAIASAIYTAEQDVWEEAAKVVGQVETFGGEQYKLRQRMMAAIRSRASKEQG